MRKSALPIQPGHHIHRPDGSFRVISVAVNFTEAVLERHSDTAHVVEPMHRINQHVYDGSWQVFDGDGVCLSRPDYTTSVTTLDDKAAATLAWRRSFVQAVRALPPYGPDNPIFVRAVDEVYKQNIKEHKRGKKEICNIWTQCPRPWTVYEWRRLVDRADGDFAVLAPPRTRADDTPRLNKDVETLITEVLNDIVASCERAIQERRSKGETSPYVPSMREAYRQVKGKVEEVNQKRLSDNLLIAPAFETVRKRYLRLNRTLLDEARYGPHVAKKRNGPFGRSYAIARILDRVEIDFFVADVLVVIEFLGLLIPLGRPIHAVAIDCNSRACLGMVIEFGEPNADTVLSLLKQILKPKSTIWQRFPDIQNRLDIYGCPALICWDNAWVFESLDLSASLLELDVARDPAGLRTPWHKPFIESWGGTFAYSFARLQPGHYKSIGESRAMEWDPRVTAQVEFNEYVGRAWKWLCDFYHAKPHSGIGNIPPAQYWFHVLHRLAGEGADSLFAPSGPEVDFKVSRRHSVRCTAQGITLQNRRYDCPELNRLFNSADPRTLYDVRADVNDVNRILVTDPRLQSPLLVPSALEYPAGLTPKAFRELEQARTSLGVVNHILIAQTERRLRSNNPVQSKATSKLTPEMRLALQLMSDPAASQLIAGLMDQAASPSRDVGQADLNDLVRTVWGTDGRPNR
jgi:hypothetical protein